MKWPDDYINKVICGDCLEVMQGIPDGAVDAVITDPPYGKTRLKWDAVIDFNSMWTELRRTRKENALVAIFAQQPFTTDLIQSNRREFKYEMIWVKSISTGHMIAHIQPMRQHENICIFYRKQPTYNRQFTKRRSEKSVSRFSSKGIESEKVVISRGRPTKNKGQYDYSFAFRSKVVFGKRIVESSVLEFSSVSHANGGSILHPTIKPIPLLKHLIATFSDPGEIVLDPFAGSGTTLVAAKQSGRKYIGIEIDPKYCKIAEERLLQEELF